MSKKKKDLNKELLDLKVKESRDMSLNSEALDLDLSDLDVNADNDNAHAKTAVSNNSSEQTIRLVSTAAKDSQKAAGQGAEASRKEEPEIKVSYGLPARQQAPVNRGGSYVAGDSQLKHSEHLRIAQNKINDLEEELVKLRQENEELVSAAETFKKLNDEYYGSIESLKAKVSDQKLTFSQEVQLLKNINQNKDKQISELKQLVEDYKSRIDNNFQRVRKREKDLEHRLEIAKIEEAAVVKSKDQLILDLKRRIDDISRESDNFRQKSQENYRELQKKQQVVRGVIRALRIALTKLEGDDDSDFGLETSDSGIGHDE